MPLALPKLAPPISDQPLLIRLFTDNVDAVIVDVQFRFVRPDVVEQASGRRRLVVDGHRLSARDLGDGHRSVGARRHQRVPDAILISLNAVRVAARDDEIAGKLMLQVY